MAELDDEELTELRELLRDAESCARLSQFEEEFCSDLRNRILLYGAACLQTEMRLSDAQWRVIRRLESKVYA